MCSTELQGKLRHPGPLLFITSVVFSMDIDCLSHSFFFYRREGPIFLLHHVLSHTVSLDSLSCIFKRVFPHFHVLYLHRTMSFLIGMSEYLLFDLGIITSD